ncbi:MAG: copper chaperone PCu(A)C [Pseudomonadota bacterium]
MKTHFFALLCLLAISACDSGGVDGEPLNTESPCADVPRGSVAPVDAWVRAAPEGRDLSAAYFILCNQSAAARNIVGVEASIARAAELHETTRDRDGVATMAPVDEIALAPGAAAAFEPGGAHVMLIGLNSPIAPGDKVGITLQFEDGGTMAIDATARDAAGGGHGHH